MTSNALDGGMLVPKPSMVQMYPSGVYVNLLDPDPALICPADIAHHLGMTCRYGGGVRRFYSVAEHSLLVVDLLRWLGQPAEIVVAGLLHDAAEAYVGDVIAPLKYALRLAEADLRGITIPGEGDNGAWFQKPPPELRGVYSDIAAGLDDAIGRRFGLDPALFSCPEVKLADMWALKIEAAALTIGGGKTWRYPHELPNGGELPSGLSWRGGVTSGAAAAEWACTAYGMGL